LPWRFKITDFDEAFTGLCGANRGYPPYDRKCHTSRPSPISETRAHLLLTGVGDADQTGAVNESLSALGDRCKQYMV